MEARNAYSPWWGVHVFKNRNNTSTTVFSLYCCWSLKWSSFNNTAVPLQDITPANKKQVFPKQKQYVECLYVKDTLCILDKLQHFSHEFLYSRMLYFFKMLPLARGGGLCRRQRIFFNGKYKGLLVAPRIPFQSSKCFWMYSCLFACCWFRSGRCKKPCYLWKLPIWPTRTATTKAEQKTWKKKFGIIWLEARTRIL